MPTSTDFLKSGAYVLSHLLISVGLLVLFSAVVSGTWHCKNQECTEPVFEGRTTHQYNPSADAIKNGYIAVEPHQDSTVYRLSSAPFILDAEVSGKRGFLPRSLVAVTKDHIENDAYVIVQGPSVPGDTDPYVEKSPEPAKKSLTGNDAESSIKQTPSEAAAAAENEPTAEIADSEPEAPSETKDTSVVTNEIDDKAVLPVESEEKLHAEPGKAENNSKEKIVAEQEKAIETQTEQPAETEQRDEHSKQEQATDSEPPGELLDTVETVEEKEANAESAVEEIPLKNNDDKDSAAFSPKEEVHEKLLDTSEEKKVLVAGIPASISDAVQELGDQPLKPQNIEVKSVLDKETVESEKKISEVAESTKATPELPSKPAVDESKKTVVADPVSEASTVAPTTAVKDAQPATVSQSTPIEQPSTVPKMPEPKVTFQDPMRSSFGSMPQLDLGQPRPVFTTKVANRFHDHHHHHHGAHGHDHHHHDHDHHHHEHKHPQDQNEVKKTEIREDSTKSSHQSATNIPETGKIALKETKQHDHDHHGTHGHDHHHDHDHDHKEVRNEIKEAKVKEDLAKASQQSLTSISEAEKIIPKETKHEHDHDHHHDKTHYHSETALEAAKKELNPADLPVDPALLVNANFTFIPPEDATQSPVNYTQLVIDAKEGKTVPGFLNEALDKEPSAGYPVPPPLDPATATEAPKIPGKSDDLPATDIEAAVQSIDRYNQHGRARFLSHRSKTVPALSEDAGSKQELPAPADTQSHPHADHQDDHQHHNHYDDHLHHDHGHEHHDHPKPVTELEKSEEITGSCSARPGGGEGSCEDVDAIAEPFEADSSDASKSTEEVKGNAKSVLHDFMVIAAKYWILLVNEFEKISPSLRLSGMGILAATTTIFLMVASSDRSIRKTMERGFEEYDHKKETELIALREQVHILMKEKQELSISRPAVPQPPLIPRLASDGPTPPCPECSGLKARLPALTKTIVDNEQLLREHGENNATLLRKNNEQMTELQLTKKDRDDLRRELDGLKLKLIELERRPVGGTGTGGFDAQREAELISLRHRVEQLQSENDSLRSNIQSFGSSDGVSMAKLAALQTERDEAASNVRLLKQLLGEKEEEIRKSRASEASGGVSARELQEKSDEARSYRKQVHRLQEEIETIKRDRESQLQIRCQSFRIAADKAQRDALMARQETIVVRQQLEDLCRKYGEQVPSVVIPQIINGTASPPGMATPPMMYSGMVYPPGPPPPTFEAFRQHVLSNSAGSSGYISPQSPGREHDRERVRERKGGKKNAQDYPRNGKNEYLDDSDTEREKRRDRSKR